MEGYFGIGIYHPKTEMNVGTLWRSAYQFGASFIFTIGARYKKQASDTSKTWRKIPLIQFEDHETFISSRFYDCSVYYIEFNDRSRPLKEVHHPERCIYVLGAEDYGIPESIMKGKPVIDIPSQRDQCFNVAVAGSIVMYDRFTKLNV